MDQRSHVDAHTYQGYTYDFYFKKFGRAVSTTRTRASSTHAHGAAAGRLTATRARWSVLP